MNQQIISKPKELKKAILTIIEQEGIEIEESVAHSFRSLYQIKTELLINYENKIVGKRTIITVPKYTKHNDIEQAIYLAHELGHHFLYKWSDSSGNIPWLTPWKAKFLASKQPHILYEHEKLAWNKAYKLLNTLNIKNKDKVYHIFHQLKNQSLQTYKPNQSIVKHLLNKATTIAGTFVQYWITAYFFISCVYVLLMNQPINQETYPALTMEVNALTFVALLVRWFFIRYTSHKY